MLHCELRGRVLTLTIDRPPVNAIDGNLASELRRALAGVVDRPEVGAVVLTGAGDRAFSAGQDLRSFAASATHDPDPGRVPREMLEAIRRCPVPVVAAMNGPAVGGGVSLLSMCDIIVAVRESWIQTPEIEVGLLGAYRHLVALVGDRRARHLYLTAERCPVDQLLASGAVARLVDRSELAGVAAKMAAELAAKDPMTMRLAKQMIDVTESLLPLEAYRVEQVFTARRRAMRDDR